GERRRWCRSQVGAPCTPRQPVLVELAIGGDERDQQLAVALERRGHGGVPRRRVDAGRQLFDPAKRLRVAQKRRDPLDRLGPHHSSAMKRASSNSPCSSRTSPSGAAVSIESAISACPPRRVRATVMLAMFTPAVPNKV